MSAPEPFKLRTPDADLADLHARIGRTRFPDEPPLEPWTTGTSLAYLKDLLDYCAGTSTGAPGKRG